MSEQTTPENAFGAMFAAWKGLLDAQVAFGSQMMQSLTGVAMPNPADMLRTLRGRATAGCGHIPPPCWMPRLLGDCTSHVGQCKCACIRVAITNCDRVARVVTADSSNKAMTVTPSSLSLGPFERGTISICVDIPKETAVGTRYDSVIWIRGCREYVLRWSVSVGTIGVDSCHEVAVDDCPDLVHHWYDHFYCARGCRTNRLTQTTAGARG